MGFLAVSARYANAATSRKALKMSIPLTPQPESVKSNNGRTTPTRTITAMPLALRRREPLSTTHNATRSWPLRLDHPDARGANGGSLGAAKFGREAGIEWPAHSCLDVNLSERAKRYLEELGHADAIPAESQDADFQAKAEFAQWLAHPNELGRPPDDLEIVDSRELVWPPDQERHGFWLVKYRVKDKTGLKEDDVGVGLVGSITFCLFSYVLEARPPEDCYAIHCYWEMSSRGLIAETDIPEESTEYDHLIRQCQIDGLTDQKVVCVVELSLELKYPQQLVAVANATRQGESGWIVIDGPRSRWYAASEMPPDDRGKTIAMIHVGRVLLGFSEEPDRRRFLRPAAPRRSPDQIIATYERVLTKARSDARQAKKLLEGHSVLSSAFGDYVSALASVRSQPKAACACAAYEAILGAVAEADPAIHAEVLDSFSMLGEHFDEYVDALIESGRQGEIPGLSRGSDRTGITTSAMAGSVAPRSRADMMSSLNPSS